MALRFRPGCVRGFQVAGDACQTALDELAVLLFQFDAKIAAARERCLDEGTTYPRDRSSSNRRTARSTRLVLLAFLRTSSHRVRFPLPAGSRQLFWPRSPSRAAHMISSWRVIS